MAFDLTTATPAQASSGDLPKVSSGFDLSTATPAEMPVEFSRGPSDPELYSSTDALENAALSGARAVTRAVGRTGMAAVQGATAIPRVAEDALIALKNRITGSKTTDTGTALRRLLDPHGTLAPTTRLERFTDEASENLVSTGGAMALGKLLQSAVSPATQLVGKVLESSPRIQAASSIAAPAAQHTVASYGGGPGAQLLAALAGGMAPGLGAAGLERLARRVLSGSWVQANPTVAENITAFDNAGTAPTVGQATEERTPRAIESLLSKVPGGAGVMQDAAERQAQGLGASLEDQAQQLAPDATPQRTGVIIERGISGSNNPSDPPGFLERTKATQNQLYDKLDQYFPAQRPMQVEGTRQALSELTAPTTGAENLTKWWQNGKIRAMYGDFLKDTGVELAPGNSPLDRLNNATSLDQLDATAAQLKVGMAEKPTAGDIDLENAYFRLRDEMRRDGQTSEVLASTTKLPYEAVKKLRTVVGSNISDAFAGQADRSQWKRLYAGLSQDIKDAVGAHIPIDPATTPEKLNAALENLPTIKGTTGAVGNEAKTRLAWLRQQLLQHGDPEQLISEDGNWGWKPSSNNMDRAAWEQQVQDALKSNPARKSLGLANPTAKAAWERANNYTDALHDRMDAIEAVMDKNGGPEAVYTAALSGTNKGATTLRAVMQSLPEDAQKQLAATYIRRMGMAPPGSQNANGDVFSSQRLLTNWSSLSPEARRVLFDRFGPELSDYMKNLSKVAGNLREGSKVFANPSGTGAANELTHMFNVAVGGGMLGGVGHPSLLGMLGGLGTAGVSMGAANRAAHAMTDPATVRWLAAKSAPLSLSPAPFAPSLADLSQKYAKGGSVQSSLPVRQRRHSPGASTRAGDKEFADGGPVVQSPDWYNTYGERPQYNWFPDQQNPQISISQNPSLPIGAVPAGGQSAQQQQPGLSPGQMYGLYNKLRGTLPATSSTSLAVPSTSDAYNRLAALNQGYFNSQLGADTATSLAGLQTPTAVSLPTGSVSIYDAAGNLVPSVASDAGALGTTTGTAAGVGALGDAGIQAGIDTNLAQGAQELGNTAMPAMPAVDSSGSALGTLGKGLGVLGAGLGTYNAINNWQSGDTGGNALRGAEAGASIGSIVPGVGTIIGGLAGGAIGALSSVFGGGKQSVGDQMWRAFNKSGGNINPDSISDTDMQHVFGGGYTSNIEGGLKDLNAALAGVYGNQHSAQGQAWNYNNFIKQTIADAYKDGTVQAGMSPSDIYTKIVQPATAKAFGQQVANSVPTSFAKVVGVLGAKVANDLSAGRDTTYITPKFTYGTPLKKARGGLAALHAIHPAVMPKPNFGINTGVRRLGPEYLFSHSVSRGLDSTPKFGSGGPAITPEGQLLQLLDRNFRPALNTGVKSKVKIPTMAKGGAVSVLNAAREAMTTPEDSPMYPGVAPGPATALLARLAAATPATP